MGEEKGWSRWLENHFVVMMAITMSILLFLGFHTIGARARGANGKNDLNQIVKALDLYHAKHGFYPGSVADDPKGWDTSLDGEFLQVLQDEGFMSYVPLGNGAQYYRYLKYPVKSFGCKKSFYILQANELAYLEDGFGFGLCPDRDWADENQNGYTMQGFD